MLNSKIILILAENENWPGSWPGSGQASSNIRKIEVAQISIYCAPIDAEFHADFKNA